MVFGRLLDRSRKAVLKSDKQATGKALLLGEGDGRFLLAALQAWPQRQILVVDGSRAMLAEAMKRISGLAEYDRERVQLIEASLPEEIEKIAVEGPFELIATHFFLDCFTQSEIEQWMPRLIQQLEPGGDWLVTEFRRPASGAARLGGTCLIAVMYWFFRISAGPR